MRKMMIQHESKYIQFSFTLLIALIGGTIFSVIHMPVPWLLGPMAAVLIIPNLVKIPLYWPVYIRDTGLLIFGYSIGLSFTKNALVQIVYQLPMMFIFTFLMLLVCALMAFFVSRLSGIDYPTILTGSVPGGLSQMVIFAEETDGIDVTTVTFLQVIRLLVIIFFIPLLVFSPLFGGSTFGSSAAIVQHGTVNLDHFFPEIFIYGLVSILFALIGKKIKSPTPFLLGPIIATIGLNLTGFHGQALPASVIDISQIMISVYIGLMMKPEKLKQKGRLLWLALISGLVLVSSGLVLSNVLLHIYDISMTTGFLSLAPGGMDQMGIIAHEVKANLSFVSGFQMFRLLFIYFAIPPMLRWVFHKRLKSRT
jgi:membrane AbrB-like protein